MHQSVDHDPRDALDHATAAVVIPIAPDDTFSIILKNMSREEARALVEAVLLCMGNPETQPTRH